jgi:hypothetical protein
VTLEWSPATDDLSDQGNLDIYLDDVKLEPSSGIVVRNGLIGFLLPSAVSPGPHSPRVDVFTINPGTTHCEPDPARCSSWISAELIPDPPAISITVQ